MKKIILLLFTLSLALLAISACFRAASAPAEPAQLAEVTPSAEDAAASAVTEEAPAEETRSIPA